MAYSNNYFLSSISLSVTKLKIELVNKKKNCYFSLKFSVVISTIFMYFMISKTFKFSNECKRSVQGGWFEFNYRTKSLKIMQTDLVQIVFTEII